MSEVYKIQVNDSEPIEVSQQVYEVSFCFNEMLKEKDKEIERLNNIINEFDRWLLGEQMMFYRGSDDERLIRYGETTNKWLELKGSEKNEIKS